jgi:uncharacterized sulfatase
MWHVIPPYGYPRARMTEPPYLSNLPRGTPTLAASLRSAGYATGIAGKWHLTANPNDGFYEQLWPEAAPHFGFDWAPPRNQPPGIQGRGDKGVDLLTNQAIGFIRDHAAHPFFLYLAHHTIHGPVMAPDALTKTYRQRGYPDDGIYSSRYMAALEHMDASVGRVLSTLDDLQLSDNTVFLFLSDNGGVDAQFDNSPLRLGKGAPYEGGIRVPAILRYPGHVKPGVVSDTPVHVTDWFPTFLDLAGAPAPSGHPLDGVSLSRLLSSGTPPPRGPLFWYMPLYDPQWGAVPAAVIRDGDWKLIEFFGDSIDPEKGFEYSLGAKVELYNLRSDIGETRDLAGRQPARAAELRGRLRAWLKSLDAPLPQLNPNYDPAAPLVR